MQQRILSTLLTSTLALSCSSAFAVDQGDWLLRVGVGYVHPNDDSGAVTGIAGSEVGVDSATNLALNVTYMATPDWSVELLGALPFKHDLKGQGSISGLGKIGETDELPPTLVVNYNFSPTASIRPYVGAGINYTTFFNTNSSSSLDTALGGSTDIDLDSSWGFAVQAGVDADLNQNWFANASIWYMDISTTGTLNTGGTIRTVDVDINPVALFVGVGYRF